jgi:hypothetical protein
MPPGTVVVRGIAWLVLAAALTCLVCVSVAHATFPGRPGHIAFSAETGSFEDQNAVLWDVDPRTRVRRQLTRRPRACTGDSSWVDGGPEYSPDGRWIAYLHWDNCGSEVRNALHIMRADGSRNRVLRSLGNTDPLSANVAIAAHGDRIALWDDLGTGDTADATFVDIVTGAVTHSAWPAVYYERLDWSATGWLVTPVNSRLNVGRPDGTKRHAITSVQSRGPLVSYDESPEWSPSGDRIAFVRKWFDDRCEDGCSRSDLTAIWTVSPGRPASRLSATSTSTTCCPTFSPSGRQLAWSGLVRFGRGPVVEAILVRPATRSGDSRVLLRASGRINGFWSIAWQPRKARR